MITLKELEKWVEEIGNIVITLNISLQNAKRLTVDKYEFEQDIKKHGFFQLHWHQLKFIMIIQISKLLSSANNEKRSFAKLCNVLENEEYSIELREKLKENSQDFTKTFKSRNDVKSSLFYVREKLSQNKQLIDKAIAARDKVYAHTDPNPNVELVKIHELEQLVDLASELLHFFEFHFFFKTTYLKDLTDWDIDYVLWYMSETRKADEDERKAKIAGLKLP